MGPATRILEAFTSALFIALLAPPIAGFIFVAIAAVATTATQELIDGSVSSILLLLFGVASAAYFIGAVPAFIAGLFLPALRRKLSPSYAVIATALAGTIFYFLTFGSHLLAEPYSLR